jgi:SAM-dependent methyltransferase
MVRVHPCSDAFYRPDRDRLSSLQQIHTTFRDPAGWLELAEDYALRRVHPEAAGETLAFLASPLRRELEANGDLVYTEIVTPQADTGGTAGGLTLRHPRIDPISYPWEWTPGQWRAAAELTLRIAGQALNAGWMLKDATPLNVLFSGARPVFVDLLSFERRDPHSSLWLAYAQFVRTFLLPLVAAKHLAWPLEATLFCRDGYEPGALYRSLPKWRRLDPMLLDVVTLAALFEGKGNRSLDRDRSASQTDPELAKRILDKRLARLGRQIRRAVPEDQTSSWSEYEQQASHYRGGDVEAKQQFVRRALERLRPRRVLDVGANVGTYSLLAAEAGAEVVALDNDAPALEVLWRAARAGRKPITALVANIARPTPAAGWRNREQLSLLDRLSGKFDMVLMLAVIHHLILREQVPLRQIGELFATLTRRWLILEWVPPSDPMYREWLRGREELYGHLSEPDLNQALAPFFEVQQRTELGNGRVLFLFERGGALIEQDRPAQEASAAC